MVVFRMDPIAKECRIWVCGLAPFKNHRFAVRLVISDGWVWGGAIMHGSLAQGLRAFCLESGTVSEWAVSYLHKVMQRSVSVLFLGSDSVKPLE